MKIPKWLHILALNESRKVGFGIWLFIVSNVFLEHAKITADVWLKCVFISGALIGFGTVVDDIVEKYAGKWVGGNGDPLTPQASQPQ